MTEATDALMSKMPNAAALLYEQVKGYILANIGRGASGAARAFAEAAPTAAVEVYRGLKRTWRSGPSAQVNGVRGRDLGRVERLIIADWFEAKTELNQKLESVMAEL